ncbi:hypothetical protein BOTNAR_0415g00090 [Botryotinia narcissicola]|uniref:Uncharacterized protein n=1 Tax=Botryotinia narcissicola TaxID=278944 RepID=A0A4Z1HYI0_9HELO|nr:hypothetical protein BOTNAR_0415g00090 [Botryotinia narcissicola]
MMRIRFKVLKLIFKRQISIFMDRYGLGNVSVDVDTNADMREEVLYVDFSLAGVMRKYFLLDIFTFGSWLVRCDEVRFLKVLENYLFLDRR